MICCIFNYAPHYRLPIYKEMDSQLNCDFYFGDSVEGKIKKLNYSELKGFKKEIRNVKLKFKYFKWQKNVIFLPFKKNYKYFILTGDTSYLSSLFILLFCRLQNKKVYLWMHGIYKKPSLKTKIIDFPFFILANHLLLYGNYAKKILLNEGFQEKKISVIYNSLDYKNQKKIRLDLKKTNIYTKHFGNNYPVMLYIGRIQKIKKIDQIIEALNILKQKNSIINLIIIGHDDENVGLRDLVNHYHLNDQVWFFGDSYNENMNAELIFNADLCVSPGNIGLTAIHSMTYGTPCITHNDFSKQMPEFEIIENNKTGLFYKKDDILDLSDKIYHWICDKTDREKIRDACYHKIDEFYNPDYQIELLKKILK